MLSSRSSRSSTLLLLIALAALSQCQSTTIVPASGPFLIRAATSSFNGCVDETARIAGDSDTCVPDFISNGQGGITIGAVADGANGPWLTVDQERNNALAIVEDTEQPPGFWVYVESFTDSGANYSALCLADENNSCEFGPQWSSNFDNGQILAAASASLDPSGQFQLQPLSADEGA